MSEIQELEAKIEKLKRKERFLADIKEVKCPFCGGSLDYEVNFSGDFYGYEYDAKGKVFCADCGCFGKEYESKHNCNYGSENNLLEQFGELSVVLRTLKDYAKHFKEK